MTINRRKALFVGFLTMCAFSIALTPVVSQDAVPVELLRRTLFIKSGEEAGTAFKVDYKRKVYLVTARHVAAALPLEGGLIQVRQLQQWTDYKIVKKILPSSDQVDIAVLQTEETVSKPYEITYSAADSVSFGQQVWFLGYPYGLGSQRRFRDQRTPKIASISSSLGITNRLNPTAAGPLVGAYIENLGRRHARSFLGQLSVNGKQEFVSKPSDD